MPIQLKVLGVIVVVLPTYAIQAERRGVEYDESTWTGAGKHVLDREGLKHEREWEKMSRMEKFQNWAMENEYKVVLGGWLASMLGAGGIIWRNKYVLSICPSCDRRRSCIVLVSYRYQTAPQKIVQARMWAQGLTIGVVIAAGLLTHQQRKKAMAERAVDHSWMEMLEEAQRDEAATKKITLPTRAVPAPLPVTAA